MKSILDENNSIQAEGGTRSMSFGRAFLQIPVEEYFRLIQRFPALESRDRKEQLGAWQRLARDPDFSKFRVGKF